jgi:hypothetical protein
MRDLLMGIMLIVELSQFIPSRIFDLQINQSLLINQLELLIEQFSQPIGTCDYSKTIPIALGLATKLLTSVFSFSNQ